MVGLHMKHHQIIGSGAAQGVLQIIQPLVGKILIHGVHHGDLFVADEVGIVAHSLGNAVLSLKKIHLVIVDTDIFNILGNHKKSPFCFIPYYSTTEKRKNQRIFLGFARFF